MTKDTKLFLEIVIGLVISLVFIKFLAGLPKDDNSTDTKCIEGFKFYVEPSGVKKQIVDENGKGVSCTVKPPIIIH